MLLQFLEERRESDESGGFVPFRVRTALFPPSDHGTVARVPPAHGNPSLLPVDTLTQHREHGPVTETVCQGGARNSGMEGEGGGQRPSTSASSTGRPGTGRGEQ
eukprot:994046-Rhodomonas_salina.1